MHKKDIVKEVIEKYIKKGKDFFELTPSYLAQLDELKGFSERTLKRGRTEYKNSNPSVLESHSKSNASVRKKIYRYLDKNPSAMPKAIQETFPEVDKKTITESRNLWKKDHPSTGSNVSFIAAKTTGRKPYNTLKRQVFEYLRQHSNASLDATKKAFSDAKQPSIEKYFEMWKKEGPALASATALDDLMRQSKNVDDMILALRNTIESQNNTIESLKSQNELLRNRQECVFPELEELAKEDIKRVEKVIRTFIKGVKAS